MRDALAISILAFKSLWWAIGALWWLLTETCKGLGSIIGVVNATHRHHLMGKGKSTHGDAKFSSWADLKGTVHVQPDGWYMGYLPERRWWGIRAARVRRLFANPDACVIGVAPRRTGKSNMTKAQVMQQAERAKKPDQIIFDPHGDIRPATIQTFIDEGYTTYFLNFENPTRSDFHNPISIVRTAPFHMAKDIDQTMRLIQPDDKNKGNEHFSEFPRVVMAGFVAYLLRTNPQDAKISKIAELMIANPKERAKLFDEMERVGGPVEKAAVTAFREAGDKERGSFQTTMTRKLAVWLRPGFKHITDTDGFTWEQVFLDPKPVVVFITTGGSQIEGAAARLILRISLNWDSDFRKSRTSVSLSRGQREGSISGCLVSVTGD